MNVVLRTDRHVKMLLNRITPALPQLVPPIRRRIQETLLDTFPQDKINWMNIKPVDKIVLAISRGVALVLFGTPDCDKAELYTTMTKHTQNGKLKCSSLRPILSTLTAAEQ